MKHCSTRLAKGHVPQEWLSAPNVGRRVADSFAGGAIAAISTPAFGPPGSAMLRKARD